MDIMKKLFYLLLALPLIFVACDDDDDDKFPEVRVAFETSGSTVVDGRIYVVQGDTLSIDSIGVEAVNSKKQVAIGAVTYYWDYLAIGTNVVKPYNISLITKNVPLGNHLLQVECSLLAVDYPIITAFFTYPVTVVATAEEIPSGGTNIPDPVTPEIRYK